MLVVALPKAFDSGRTLAAERKADEQVQVIGGTAVVSATGAAQARFLAEVRARIPEREKFRLQAGAGPHCGGYQLAFFWLAYQLLPRPAVCSGDLKWWVYFRTVPRLAPGSRVVARGPYGMLLVETRGRSVDG